MSDIDADAAERIARRLQPVISVQGVLWSAKRSLARPSPPPTRAPGPAIGGRAAELCARLTVPAEVGLACSATPEGRPGVVVAPTEGAFAALSRLTARPLDRADRPSCLERSGRVAARPARDRHQRRRRRDRGLRGRSRQPLGRPDGDIVRRYRPGHLGQRQQGSTGQLRRADRRAVRTSDELQARRRSNRPAARPSPRCCRRRALGYRLPLDESATAAPFRGGRQQLPAGLITRRGGGPRLRPRQLPPPGRRSGRPATSGSRDRGRSGNRTAGSPPRGACRRSGSACRLCMVALRHAPSTRRH